MNKLCVKLPPFAPDYSGACSALFELGGLVVIHDASGCTGNYTGYDEPRWYGSKSYVYCSKLREIDAVMGDDEKLVKKILDAAADLDPRFIAVLGSPVPMVIGADMQGIAAEIENRSGIPAFGFSTTGLDYYDKGASSAFLAAAGKFVKPVPEKKSGSMNILGLTPLDYSANRNASDMREFFESRGWEVLSAFAMGSGLDDMERSAGAQVNLVVASSGLPLARYFEREHGIPFVCGAPLGEAGSKVLEDELAGASGAKERLGGRKPAPGRRVLIVHDQIIANSIRVSLEADYGVQGAAAATPFSFADAIAREGDLNPSCEKEIAGALSGGFDAVIADPLFRDLMPEDSGARFIELPHAAVSSKLYWDRCPGIIGPRLCEYLGSEYFI
ncbi:MAG: nitrogenase component 1 [Synergistaceae bacterium]|jgi:hypothetical protein|nr:nitrogenase component 1 [Synergistaceae bacterium]